MSALPEFVQDLGQGVFAIDTGFQRPRFDAAYLLVDQGRAAFIDTGTRHAVPRLLAALSSLGLRPAAVDWVIPTHVHLDHAGGVGELMRHLPRAHVLVHPRGAPHLIDPFALYQGALAVYGQAEMDRSYGEIVPVPAPRVLTSHDDMAVNLGTRSLRLIDTPGHARHHHCIWDPLTQGWFTGDTFGLSYREFDVAGRPWIIPTTTPVQFEPEPLKRSIERLLAAQPQRMYLTHYGMVDQVAALGAQLLSQIDDLVVLARRLADAPDRHDNLREALMGGWLASLQAHGCHLAPTQQRLLLAMDAELNAQGLAVWLDRATR
jgi:glyoxylase-like metal-dependent hydrolase (beta-lactamase superfamily II)